MKFAIELTAKKDFVMDTHRIIRKISAIKTHWNSYLIKLIKMRIFSIFALILILGTLKVSAQTTDQTFFSDIKAKISELFNTVTELIEKIGGFFKITEIFKFLWDFLLKIFFSLKDILGIINGWLEQNIGVNIGQFFVWIGKGFIWILELTIKILKGLIALIS